MAEAVQTGMHYVVVALSILVVLLAVWMATVGLLWIAIPDGIFGIGVGWLAWASRHGEAHPQMATAVESGPDLRPGPPPPPPAPVAAPAPPPEPARPAASPSPAPGYTPGRKKKKRRH